MLRIHSEHTLGWTTLQRGRNSQQLNDVINKQIERIPSWVALTQQGKSLQIVTASEIFNIHIMKNGLHRDDEHCVIEQHEYTYWQLGKTGICQKKSRNPDSYGSTSYYAQQHCWFQNQDVVLRLAEPSDTSQICRIKREKKHAKVCRDENCIGRIMMTNFMVTVVQCATHAAFVSDRAVTRYTEKNVFSIPRAVNICYTGTVNGQIEPTAISSVMNQAKKKGPCGSEIHIDTSMGVMQIFGNNSGSRKITCKAFLNITEADFIVDRVCAMVIFKIYLLTHKTLYCAV